MHPYLLPKDLYNFEGVNTLLFHNESAIIHKKLTQDIIDSEKLIVSHSIVYLIKGRVRVNSFEGEEISIGANEMLFMPRDSYLISDYISEDKQLEAYIVFFTQTIADKFLNGYRSKEHNKSTITSLHVDNNIVHYFNALEKMDFTELNNKALLEIKLLEFLHLINSASLKEALSSCEHVKQKRDIERLMLEHYSKNLSVIDYAHLSGRSLSSFNREFKLKFSKTPKQWLIEKRISQAKSLLDEGQSVTQSAFEVGYSNVSHFIKAYKSIYDTTPKQMQLE